MWKTDGTTGGTMLVKEIINGTIGGFQTASTYDYYDYPFNIVFNIGNTIYFVANDYASVPNGNTPNNNIELWKSDGSSGGTSKVMDIQPSTTAGSYPSYFTNAIGKIFFTATNNSYGRELWTIDVPVSDGPELISNSELKVFPNPSTGELTVKFQSSNEYQQIQTLSIEDTRGREYYHRDIKLTSNYYNQTLDIKDLAPGIYFVKLTTDTGLKIHKIVKQ
ncbi:MAG: T9SS type A sorting domain-containing protein [Bacteroidetes bacterium]|nr:T9SS type A sorting domain-containing protein [Bacteroidota bacterium]